MPPCCLDGPGSVWVAGERYGCSGPLGPAARSAPQTAAAHHLCQGQMDSQTDPHRGESPVALSLSSWPQMSSSTSPFPSFHPADRPPQTSSFNPSLPLGAGGESRSTLGTIRGLGGAGVAGGSRGGVGAGVGGKKVQGNSGTVSCWGGEGQRVGVKAQGATPPPSARCLTGDPGSGRRAPDTSGGSRACSGLAVHRQHAGGPIHHLPAPPLPS